MLHVINLPVFLYLVPIVIVPPIHRIGMTTWNLPMSDTRRAVKARVVCVIRSKIICLHPLLYGLIGIDRIRHSINRSLKNNGWHDTSSTAHSSVCSLSLLHWIRSSRKTDGRNLRG